METAHRGAADEPGSAFEGGMNPPVFLKIPVQLLKIMGGQLAEFDVPDAWDGIDIHHQLVCNASMMSMTRDKAVAKIRNAAMGFQVNFMITS